MTESEPSAAVTRLAIWERLLRGRSLTEIADEFGVSADFILRTKDDLIDHLSRTYGGAGTIVDEVTQTWTRSYGVQRLHQELLAADHRNWTLSVVFADIDNLKSINDHHGHFAGDQLLKNATRRWQQLLRASDWICRWGGDEFLWVLPKTPHAVACQVVERLRAQLPAIPFSAGVAEWDRRETADELVRRADRAMYIDKRQRKAGEQSSEIR
jgi:diguanylate cyclase (GGDEF)-like protein